jgi:hypothetical protein
LGRLWRRSLEHPNRIRRSHVPFIQNETLRTIGKVSSISKE